jgi:NRAMP (natural resistance-associated macrophage protein)-like metal ion transporter
MDEAAARGEDRNLFSANALARVPGSHESRVMVVHDARRTRAARLDKFPLAKRILGALGPGLITGASDDDPSGIGTYSQAGAQFGFSIGWTMLFSYPLMVAIQETCARIGRTTGHGIAGTIREHYPGWLLHFIVMLLFLANTINIGADLSAMGDAVQLLIGGPRALYVVLLAATCAGLQIFVSYARYAPFLKWMTLSLFAYFATLLVVKLDWLELARGVLVPSFAADSEFWTTVVAVLGTTISPYLFFWQAAQESEDIRAHPEREALRKAPRQGASALDRIRADTLIGMAVSNLVALAIIATTAATLHAEGMHDIRTSAQAAAALKPLAGESAFVLFALGIVGTGMLAIPVLAGSSAYALAEARKWPAGLGKRLEHARGFYGTIAAATLCGVLLNFIPVDPIRALFLSAVVNGVVAAPVMALIMLMATRKRIMGRFVISRPLQILGWTATAVMAAASAAMLLAAAL